MSEVQIPERLEAIRIERRNTAIEIAITLMEVRAQEATKQADAIQIAGIQAGLQGEAGGYAVCAKILKEMLL